MPLLLPEARFTGTNIRDEETRGAVPGDLDVLGSRAWPALTCAVPCRHPSLVADGRKF